MPAVITHYLFGEQALALTPGANAYTPEQKDAYLLGCQGPDPFFFRALSTNSRPAHAFASMSHSLRIAQEFEAYFDALEYLTDADKTVGRPYLLGFLAHYTLDTNAHPFVFGQQYALIDAMPELGDGDSQVHAVLESDIDSSLLMRKKGLTPAEFHPLNCLVASEKTLQVAGLLHTYVAQHVYGIALKPTEFAGAVQDMRAAYRMIESPSGIRAHMVGKLERLVQPHSILASLRHRSPSEKTDAALNDNHLTWRDPFSAKERTESFEDLFEAGLDEYAESVHVFLAGGPMQKISQQRNFNGSQLTPDEEIILTHKR